MKTYKDCIKLGQEDFDENGHYKGPFDLACLCNADVEIQGNLGSIHFPNNGEGVEGGGLVTNGYIKIGKGTDINVHGPLCAEKLATSGDVYCSSDIEVHHVKCKGKLIAERDIVITGSFYVGNRIVTPRLVLATLEIVMPQRYHHERYIPKKG